ncbi:LIM domain-binding protein 2 isoform X2 [Aethina tumida]|uniref:LIM domain-binding protein 2 isoform X2 n=1 Tax=Aethina tumida TaxID=116153 RepID=UPI00096B42E3|nr:LIM domain-binding protein 2 isoform X2 [Aethina tumida]XP_049823852.1 LIM domain-binding protein 2 isoform X2 [Aethina tumida]
MGDIRYLNINVCVEEYTDDSEEEVSSFSSDSGDNPPAPIDLDAIIASVMNSNAPKNEPKPPGPPLMPEVNLDDFDEVAELAPEPIDNGMNLHASNNLVRSFDRSGYISRTPRRYVSPVDAENPYLVLASLNERLAASPYHFREGWWERLVKDFFYDDACMEFFIPLLGQVKKYKLDRANIPAFFHSLYPTRKSSVNYQVPPGNIKRKNKLLLLESNLIKCQMKHGEPLHMTVNMEGESIMVLQTSPIDNMKIRKWCWQTTRLNDEKKIMEAYKYHRYIVESDINKFVSSSGWPQATMELLWSCGGSGPPPVPIHDSKQMEHKRMRDGDSNSSDTCKVPRLS